MMRRFLNWKQTAGIGFILAFAVLLAVRLNLFVPKGPDAQAVQSMAQHMAGQTVWMNIFQHGSKIGFAKRDFVSREQGGYILSEEVFMRLSAMGMIQEIGLITTGILHPDLTLDRFSFRLSSGLFSFVARGEMEDDTLALVTGQGPDERRTKIPMRERPYLGSALTHAAVAAKLEPGKSISFPVFDPATTGYRPAILTMIGNETITVMGERVNAKKLAIDFMGNKQTAWINEKGQVLAEEGALGLRLERTTPEDAMLAADEAVKTTVDLTEYASVPSNVSFKDPEKLSLLVLEVDAPIAALAGLDGGRQSFSANRLSVEREDTSQAQQYTGPPPVFEAGRTFLEPTPFIQADAPQIKDALAQIVTEDDSPLEKAQKIVSWVYEALEKRPVFSVPDALETLQNRVGDCNEHAVLVAALARAAGIPAKMEIGLVYQRGRFYYHAWNSLYLGQWITADAALGQFPADVTHLRFAAGDAQQQIDIVGLIGRLKLKVVEHKP
ncbi:MAG: transglutaminase-like domain-containing protein [Desulfatibacillaceae bacterium]|nr:transglutaminase-like domain-containing protein [Desulfatibacillaceae bacterium]